MYPGTGNIYTSMFEAGMRMSIPGIFCFWGRHTTGSKIRNRPREPDPLFEVLDWSRQAVRFRTKRCRFFFNPVTLFRNRCTPECSFQRLCYTCTVCTRGMHHTFRYTPCMLILRSRLSPRVCLRWNELSISIETMKTNFRIFGASKIRNCHHLTKDSAIDSTSLVE